MDNFTALKNRLQELTHLKSTLALLWWDAEVNMPRGGVAKRSKTISYMSELLHQKLLDPEFEKILQACGEQANLSDHEQAMLREVEREFNREKKLPTEFVTELAHLTAEASHIWAEARQKSDFKLFQPYVEKIVNLKRQEAQLVGFKESPYDALLDVYEPYLTTAEVGTTLEELKVFLVGFIKKIKASSIQIDPTLLKGHFDISKQKEFNNQLIKTIGFNFDSGRLDSSTHPFSTGFHPDDVRITTRFFEDDVVSAVMSSLHEAGHGIYEQGLARDHFGTPLGETASTGIHESQSRLWENLVGRSKPFWQYMYPRLQQTFPEPFKKVSLETFYQVLNAVKLSLIRVEADEVTYNLHIIVRFEIEKALIEGSIAVGDIPEIWNVKMKEYFDINVPDNAHGVLQDIHWSSGLIGYFPTYTLGNLYAAQLYQAMCTQLPNVETDIVSGNFDSLRTWLSTHIHLHGKRYAASELIHHATDQSLSSQYFIEYLTRKYSDIYKF